MDDRLFEEMLQEIDAMTTEEYWSLYREAEKLVDFPPEDLSFFSIPFSEILTTSADYRFNNTTNVEAVSVYHTNYSQTILDGELSWLKAA